MTETSKGLLGWLRGATVGSLLTVRVWTTPSPTHRVIPLWSARRMVHTVTYSAYMADCQRTLAEHAGAFGELRGELGAFIEVIGQRPKSTRLHCPKGDVDNYVKGVMDAATKARVWHDDTNVVALGVTKRWTLPDELAGVVIHIGNLKESK